MQFSEHQIKKGTCEEFTKKLATKLKTFITKPSDAKALSPLRDQP